MPSGGTILLVEDEEDIASLVRPSPARVCFRLVWATRRTEGLGALEQHEVRLAILDLQLPDADGFDVCRAIRATSSLPVVMLTARDEEVDRVTGLELGADDYVTKPFSPRELAARIKAILRRVDERDVDRVLAAHDIVLRRDSMDVTVGGAQIELTGKEFDLLACFLEHPGIVLSREKLLDLVWGMTYPGGTRTVDVHVAQLRRKLGDAETIRTVRGAGYKLIAQ
jgi:DNA-binding response OmpR family regulator